LGGEDQKNQDQRQNSAGRNFEPFRPAPSFLPVTRRCNPALLTFGQQGFAAFASMNLQRLVQRADRHTA